MNPYVKNLMRFMDGGLIANFAVDMLTLAMCACIVGFILDCFGSVVLQAAIVIGGALVCIGLFCYALAYALSKITEV